MNPDDLMALNEEIAGMARAGLPLDEGLAALAREMGRGRLQQVTATLASDLKAGHTLPEALERQGKRVPQFYAGLVAAGIRTGRISQVLANLGLYARAMADLRSIIVEALFYPAVVLLFAGSLVGFLLIFVIPRFKQIFMDFGMKLPVLTEWMLTLGDHPLVLIAIPVLLLAGLFLLRLVLRFSERGRCTWARLVYSIPIVGTLIRSARLASFTDLLALLVDHDIPLPVAFRLAGQASSDPLMAGQAQLVHDELSQGIPLSEVLQRRGLVPRWVGWMTGLGERRGTLGSSLHQVAETYRRQVEMRTSFLRSVLPPFLIIVLVGGFVSPAILSLFLPLIKLLEGLSK
jgi:type II secretory pathway component PulF